MSAPLPLSGKTTGFIILFISLFLLLSYGLSLFGIATDRNGLNGNIYYYYHISRIAFICYNGLIVIGCIYFIVTNLLFIIRSKPAQLRKNAFRFVVFTVLLAIGEVYLQSGFTGKG